MSKHKHQKRKKNKLTLVFPLFLILLAFSGMYAEHSYPEHHATKKSSTPATKTTTDLTNQQPIEPKNATSAGIEQLLVEKNFSGTVLVFQHGQVILNKAYGWKDQARRIHNTIHTQYCIGSVQKGQTAYLIMQAVKSGKISLEEKLSTFYPQISNSEKISIKDMLNMSSGLRIDEKKIAALNTTDPQKILSETIRQTTVAANSSYSYQPVNYVLLAGILEQVYHTDYSTLFYLYLPHARVHPDLRFFREKWTKTLDDFSKKIVASLHFLSVVVLRLLHVDWSAGFLQS